MSHVLCRMERRERMGGGGGRVTLLAVPVQCSGVSELYRVFRSNENHRANGVRFSSDFKTLFSPVERTAPSPVPLLPLAMLGKILADTLNATGLFHALRGCNCSFCNERGASTIPIRSRIHVGVGGSRAVIKCIFLVGSRRTHAR